MESDWPAVAFFMEAGMAKALSLVQPWASLLASGLKQCETRGWKTEHRGALLIHASKRWNGELRDLCAREPFASALRKIGVDMPGMGPSGMPFGAIIGQVDVVDCFRTECVVSAAETHPCFGHDGTATLFEAQKRLFVTDLERALGDYSPHRYAWFCANAKQFDQPIPFTGALNVFEVPDDVVKPSAPILSRSHTSRPWR